MIEMTFRVSEAESFRQWREDEDAELEVLLARMRGRSGATEAMRAGTAFHKALELAAVGESAVLEAMGYTFRIAGDFELAIPAIREVRASKRYEFEDYAVTISGQLDAIEGMRVEDHKTTSRFDPERYLTGYQWRLYLDIFAAGWFRWNVFEIAQVNDDPLEWEVHATHRLEQYRYPGMAADCQSLAMDLGRFARKWMPERIRNEAVAA